MKLLLDSVILIDHFNNINQATQFILKHQANLSISVITRAEVLTGFFQKQRIKLAKKLLDKFILYPITGAEADMAAELRSRYHWKLADALQAAIAKIHHLKLVTRNTKDFSDKKFPFVLHPYKLS